MTNSRTIGASAETFTQSVHSVEDHTGLPGVGAGAWEFVKTVELMAPAATINVTGLDGDTDERYLLLYNFIHDNAGAGGGGGTNVRLHPNGDTVNGRTSRLQYVGGGIANTENSTEIHVAQMLFAAGANLVRVQGELTVYAGGLAGNGQMFKSTDAISRQDVPNAPAGNFWTGSWNSQANITSLSFDLFLKNFHTGTKIHVYKLKK